MLGRECPGVRLRALLPFLGLLVCLCSGCSGAWAAQPARPGEPLARAFSELFQDADRITRLEACFLSVGLPERPEHVRILRQNLSTDDPLERIVTLYALAAMTRAPKDVDAFLAAFPVDPGLFLTLQDAEWRLSATLGEGIADFLLLLVHEPRTRDRALPHLARIISNKGVVENLTAEEQDVYVKPYLGTHRDTFLLEGTSDFALSYLYEEERKWACGAKLTELLLNNDPDSRITALLMHRRLFDPDAARREMLQTCKQPKPLRDAAHAILMQRVLDYTSFMKNFPTDQATVEAVLRTEKRLYKPPFHSLAFSFMNRGDPHDAAVAAALLRYGNGRLEAVERHYLQDYLKGESLCGDSMVTP